MKRALLLFAGTQFGVSAAYSQQLGQGQADVGVSIVRVFLALIFTLCVAVAAIFVLRRKFAGGSSLFVKQGSRVQLVEQLSLGGQQRLFLLRIDDQDYLALVSPQGPNSVGRGPRISAAIT